jgi:hypothetical protein
VTDRFLSFAVIVILGVFSGVVIGCWLTEDPGADRPWADTGD